MVSGLGHAAARFAAAGIIDLARGRTAFGIFLLAYAVVLAWVGLRWRKARESSHLSGYWPTWLAFAALPAVTGITDLVRGRTDDGILQLNYAIGFGLVSLRWRRGDDPPLTVLDLAGKQRSEGGRGGQEAGARNP